MQLTREIPSGKLYRMSEVRVIDDILPDEPDESQRAELVETFRKLYQGTLDPDLDALFDTDLPMGVLTDIVAQAMGLPSSIKQALLGEPLVARRAVNLLRRMKELPSVVEDEPTSFPPPFSWN